MTQIPFQPTSASEPAESMSPNSLVVDNPPAKNEGQETQASSQASPGDNTLRRQLFTTVLPLTVAPLAVVSVVGYGITQRNATADLNQAIEGQALLAEDLSRTIVQGDLRQINTVTVNPLVQGLAIAASEVAVEEDLLDADLGELETRFAETKAIEPNQEFNDYLGNVSEVENITELIVTDSNGFNIGFSQTPSTFSQATDTWWQQGRAQTQWVSDPEFDASSGTFGFTISRAIEASQTGEFLGVIKGFFSTDELAQVGTYLQEAGISGSQQVEIVDVSSGGAIARFNETGNASPENLDEALDIVGGQSVLDVAIRLSEIEQTGQEIDLDALAAEFQESFAIRNVSATQQDLAEAGAETASSLALSFDYEGKRYVMAAVDVIDWVSVASIDLSEIQAEGRGLLVLFAIIGVTLAAVSSIFTIGLSRRLSSPLDALSNDARQVAAGNLDITAQLQGTSETQTLAQTFNDLVRRVKGSLLEQTRNAEESNLLAYITGAKLDTKEDLSGLFEQTVQQTRTLLNTDRVVVYRFDRETWGGRIVAESVESGLPSAFAQGLDDPCIPESVREKYLNDGLYLHNNVATAQFHPEHLKLLESLKIQSVVGTPILSQGQLYGLLITHHCHKLHTWQPNEISFMTRLGQQLGLVLERVTLRDQTEQLAREQQQIKETLQRNAMQLLIDVDPVSQGDLTVRAQVTEDEIGTVADSYNATIANLRKIVGQVQKAARQVADTTASSETSAQSLSQSAIQQAEDISAALDRAQEMANSAQLVANNAAKAGEAVQAAALTVQEGDDAMNRTVDGILGIRETVAETAKKVKRLGESSQKISNVVNLISGFAAQTNMLALNASIEASRAGEDSKGFAVVAEEVRELARQSAEATTEIEKLVSDIQSETNEVVVAMETGTEQVVSGTKLVDETRQSLNKITDTSRQISELVASITQATVVQTQASKAVTGAMTNAAAIATQSTAEANKVYESFGDLNDVAKMLQAEVDQFKVE